MQLWHRSLVCLLRFVLMQSFWHSQIPLQCHSSEFLFPSPAPVPFKELVHQLLISPLVFQAWVANSNIWERLHGKCYSLGQVAGAWNNHHCRFIPWRHRQNCSGSQHRSGRWHEPCRSPGSDCSLQESSGPGNISCAVSYNESGWYFTNKEFVLAGVALGLIAWTSISWNALKWLSKLSKELQASNKAKNPKMEFSKLSRNFSQVLFSMAMGDRWIHIFCC